MYNGLRGDTFTRNVMDLCTQAHTYGWTDRQMDGRRTDFGKKLIYCFFPIEKREYN